MNNTVYYPVANTWSMPVCNLTSAQAQQIYNDVLYQVYGYHRYFIIAIILLCIYMIIIYRFRLKKLKNPNIDLILYIFDSVLYSYIIIWALNVYFRTKQYFS